MKLCAHCHEGEVRKPGGKYCSRRCLALDQPPDVVARKLRKAHETTRRLNRERVIADVIAEVRAVIGSDGRVSAEDCTRLVVKYRRIGYQRGFGVQWNNARRGIDGRRKSKAA